MAELTLEQVDTVLGSHSMAVVRSWLLNLGISLPVSARSDFAKKVFEVMKTKELSLESLRLGMIEVEEASRKRINLYRFDVDPKTLERIRKQIVAVCGKFSNNRTSAPQLPSSTKRVYVIEDESSIRAKWAETHTVYVSNLATLSLVPEEHTKIVVLVLAKETGVVQIRYDRPGTKHPHGNGVRSAAAEYFEHFRKAVEDLLGIQLESVELRPKLAKVINAVPRIVESRSTEQLSDDGYTIKVIPKLRGKDVRDAKDVGAMTKHGATHRVHEVEALGWLPEASNSKITRKVKTHIDGRESYVRLEADYHDGEIDYVLAHLL